MNNLTYTVRELSFGYGQSDILNGLNLTFEPGKLHAIVGPNGSGKSTLLDIMAGHRTPTSGTVLINETAVEDHAPSQLAQLTAMVPQEFNFNFPFTVVDAVLMGRHPHIPRFSRPSDDDADIVQSAMKTMDITHLADRPLSELSGGEKQRTVVARALAQTTPGLLLDEPTSSMDIRHALAAMTELRRLAHAANHTIIVVLHDLNLAAAFCDTMVILKNGRLHTQGTAAETLTPETLEDVFGVHAQITEKTGSSGLVITYDSKETT